MISPQFVIVEIGFKKIGKKKRFKTANMAMSFMIILHSGTTNTPGMAPV